ncbi:uncharacterized protein [Apostichopus japonicus]|uniref:uncharacterized protein n=1 Tax=Stichopus japonicus TaxID=307972 RepID=UPI003AB440A6
MRIMDIMVYILCMSFSLLPVLEAEPLIASVLALEGDSAEIVCPTIESYGSYFWRKGDSIHDSTTVASIVDGVHRADSKNYAVTANGTFFIKNVTLKDEGKYFCRGVSVKSSSTTNIMVYVQASPPNFELSIDHCGTESSCLRYINLSEPIELICRAKNASPSMMLKWFNGSREIESSLAVVKLYQKDAPSSTTIRSTIKAVYRTPITLTCQAVYTKSRADGGKFVNIRLEQPVPITNEKSASDRGWKIAAVIAIIVLCIMCITCIVHKCRKRITG